MPGQVWQYSNRLGEDDSTLTILKIDELEEDVIIHIPIDGIQLGQSDHIAHLPCSAEAIEASVVDFVRHLAILPEFEEGYSRWKELFNNKKAGYWTIPVSQVLDAIAAIMKQQAVEG